MRVAIVGAGGQVGRQALQHLFFENHEANLDLVLIGRVPDRIRGVLADIVSTLPLVARDAPLLRRPRVTIGSDLKLLHSADLVVLSAANWPSPEDERAAFQHDPSGRLAQSYANARMINVMSQTAAGICPDALFLVVTNQSDMMAAVARRHLPAERVLGFGGIVDSARLRMRLAEALHVSMASLASGNHVVGYHNYDLIPLSSSLSEPIDEVRLSALTDDVRRYGEDLSRLKREGRTSGDFGANVLPGYGVHLALRALSGYSAPLEESFNVCLPRAVASLYGTLGGSALSVPIRIEKGHYTPITSYTVHASERSFLANAQLRMDEACAALPGF